MGAVTWVEVACGTESRRWDYEFGPPAELGSENYPTLVLTCGDKTRVAMLSSTVVEDADRVKSVAVNMARWEDAAEDVMAVRLYVWGLVGFADGTSRTTLCLLIVDLDGTVSGMLPIDMLEPSDDR